jgi:hypothetical protein
MLLQLPLLQVNGSSAFVRPSALSLPNEMLESELCTLLHEILPALSDSFYLAFSRDRSSVQVRLRLPGGKGGFGSQLRAQGNKMSSKKRAGNYEACRDLSGQRLRSQKQAKLIADYVDGEAERVSSREREIREKMQKHLEAPNRKIMFNDAQYLKTSRKIVDGTEDAVRSLFAYSGSDSESDIESESESGSDNDKDNDNDNDNENENERIESCDDDCVSVQSVTSVQSVASVQSFDSVQSVAVEVDEKDPM